MLSSYRTLGRYIRPVRVKNIDLAAKSLLGINIDKFFMPSVANVVGTDLTNYKIVRKGQFACNRMHVGRDYRIPVALSNYDDPFMVSPAYDVFEIIDQDVLLPEYLMLWFSRREFDRNAWFHTDADVRGGLPWSAFCELKLPIPSLEMQLEIVREHNAIQNRIALNNQLIKKLEETAQAVYKHWFVDFEFPDKEGKPYKSNGGELVWCEELNVAIPLRWTVNHLNFFIEVKYGKDYKHLNLGVVPMYGSGGVMGFVNAHLYDKRSILIPRKGSLSNIMYVDDPFWSVDTMFYSKLFKDYFGFYIFRYLKNLNWIALNVGSAVPSMTTTLLNGLRVITPDENTLMKFDSYLLDLQRSIKARKQQNKILSQIVEMLSAKMTNINTAKYEI